jgi:hypothetical protein
MTGAGATSVACYSPLRSHPGVNDVLFYLSPVDSFFYSGVRSRCQSNLGGSDPSVNAIRARGNIGAKAIIGLTAVRNVLYISIATARPTLLYVQSRRLTGVQSPRLEGEQDPRLKDLQSPKAEGCPEFMTEKHPKPGAGEAFEARGRRSVRGPRPAKCPKSTTGGKCGAAAYSDS